MKKRIAMKVLGAAPGGRIKWRARRRADFLVRYRNEQRRAALRRLGEDVYPARVLTLQADVPDEDIDRLDRKSVV